MQEKKMKYMQFLFILLLISNKPNDINPFRFYIKVGFLCVPPMTFSSTLYSGTYTKGWETLMQYIVER